MGLYFDRNHLSFAAPLRLRQQPFHPLHLRLLNCRILCFRWLVHDSPAPMHIFWEQTYHCLHPSCLQELPINELLDILKYSIPAIVRRELTFVRDCHPSCTGMKTSNSSRQSASAGSFAMAASVTERITARFSSAVSAAEAMLYSSLELETKFWYVVAKTR